MTAMTTRCLAALTARALERTAFLMSEEAPDAQAPLGQPMRCAVIRYRGPSAGAVTVRATGGFLRALAAGVLGVEPCEVTDEASCDDAIKELANILGGSVVLELGGADSAYSLGLPELASADDRLRFPATAVTCRMECEGEPLLVTWCPIPKPAARAA